MKTDVFGKVKSASRVETPKEAGSGSTITPGPSDIPAGWRLIESKAWGRCLEDQDGERWYGCPEHDLFVEDCGGCYHANHECEGLCHP